MTCPLWVKIVSWSVIFFLAAPILVIILISFSGSTYFALSELSFSLRWYEELANKPEFLDAFLKSLYIGLAAAGIATLLGTAGAVAVVRYQFPGRPLVQLLMGAPLILPVVIIGLSFLIFFSRLGLVATYQGVILAHVVVCIPYVVRCVLPSAMAFDPHLELAARDLGATWFKMARHVLIPLIKPGVLAGALFAFTVSFDNLTVTLFITGPQMVTLPIRIFDYIRYYSDPLIAAVCTLLVVFSAVLVLLIQRFFGYSVFAGDR